MIREKHTTLLFSSGWEHFLAMNEIAVVE